MTERLRTVRCVACCGPLAVAGAANGVMASYRLDAWGENLPGWNEIVDSTIRAVLDNGDVVVATEGGIVSAYGGFSGSTWWWKGSDVVRTLAAVGDVDADSNPDIAAAMLDGLVVVLSSRPPSPEELMVPLPMNHSHAVPPASDRPVMTAVPATANAEEVPILLYHDVVPEVHYRWGVSLENFRMQMDELVKRGYTAVTLDEVADWIEGRRTLPARSVCITFDGPYEGHALYVRDILRERKLKAALYITSDWIGTVNHADWHQLRAMEKSGVITIENHTQNHRNLPELTPRLVRLQLAGCNEAIARHLGGKVSRHHAYPSGVYNDEVAGLLKDKGFRTATTVDPGPATRKSDLFKLPRYTLKNDTTIEQFRGWLRE